jgi:hypothetical protein
MTALLKPTSNCKQQTHPLVRQDVHKDYNCNFQLKKKNTDCGYRGAWQQDKLIGGKLPVVK